MVVRTTAQPQTGDAPQSSHVALAAGVAVALAVVLCALAVTVYVARTTGSCCGVVARCSSGDLLRSLAAAQFTQEAEFGVSRGAASRARTRRECFHFQSCRRWQGSASWRQVARFGPGHGEVQFSGLRFTRVVRDQGAIDTSLQMFIPEPEEQ